MVKALRATSRSPCSSDGQTEVLGSDMFPASIVLGIGQVWTSASADESLGAQSLVLYAQSMGTSPPKKAV